MKVLVDCTLQIKAFDEYIWLCYKCLQNWFSFSSCILNVLSKLCTYYSFRAKFCHSVNHPPINSKIDFFWDHADINYCYCQLSTSRYFKVRIFWEGHKIWKNLPLKIWRYWVKSNYKWKIFFKFVTFSENLNFTKKSHNIVSFSRLRKKRRDRQLTSQFN